MTSEHRGNVNNGAERVCVMSWHAYVLAEAIFARRGRTSLAGLRFALPLYQGSSHCASKSELLRHVESR